MYAVDLPLDLSDGLNEGPSTTPVQLPWDLLDKLLQRKSLTVRFTLLGLQYNYLEINKSF